jgi:transposase-like protein
VEESADFEGRTQEELRLDLRGLFQGAIRVVIENVLQEEVRELVGARRFERLGQRKDVRNGTYLRRLLTSLGQIDVTVPRTRASGSACDVLGRYHRRAPEVDALIAEAYVNGVSTRKMGAVTEALLGERVGRTTVSRVSKRLEDEVEALRTTPLTEPIRYIYLDATFLDARWARTVENVAALVAYGITPDGKRRLLGVTIGPEESEASWAELLEQLIARGLSGVALVIADEHAGLLKAVRRLLPEARRQRCVVHLERNVLTKTPARLRGRLARQVAAIFQAPSKAEAAKRLASFETTFTAQVPEAVACLKHGFDAATQFYAFPAAHWVRLRSTNGLERLHGEIKRRIRAVGAFPDRASALRLIVAVALRVTAIWDDRRYLDMTTERKEGRTTKQAA